ncbi:MAG: DUF4263 domain-containing protein [Verrucomicrobia bacterium]|nr:DUF4263 domain-containing protein [Verrucomicrobiota bacterium]
MVEDDQAIRELYQEVLATIDVSCFLARGNSDAFDYLERVKAARGDLDFIVSDIVRPGKSQRGEYEGVALVRAIRGTHDDVLVNSCFRLRHLPIVVITGGGFPLALQLKDSFPELQIREKPLHVEEFLSAISDALTSYRHAVLSGLQRVGLSVFWKEGRYRLATAYTVPAHRETKYFVIEPTELGNAYSRLVLVADRSPIAGVAVSLFEEMLNNARTTERDLQRFLELHPEFLLGDAHDSYWAEPSLASSDRGQVVRPDFVLQPLGHPNRTWDWTMVELKAPRAPLFASPRFHLHLSQHVLRMVTQLEDYADFFADPRNQEVIRRRFGGVVPRPRLVGVIGRLPSDHVDQYAVLRSRVSGVTITTYDEILELRRAKVGRMRALGI